MCSQPQGPGGWQRDLVEEGIEPNPGPDSNVVVWTFNCQGPKGAWSVLDYVQSVKDQPLAIAIQELRLGAQEQEAWERAACRAGFPVYGMGGKEFRDKGGRPRGVFLLLHCTAWWRVIYLLCLVVSRLKGVLVI